MDTEWTEQDGAASEIHGLKLGHIFSSFSRSSRGENPLLTGGFSKTFKAMVWSEVTQSGDRLGAPARPRNPALGGCPRRNQAEGCAPGAARRRDAGVKGGWAGGRGGAPSGARRTKPVCTNGLPLRLQGRWPRAGVERGGGRAARKLRDPAVRGCRRRAAPAATRAPSHLSSGEDAP